MMTNGTAARTVNVTNDFSLSGEKLQLQTRLLQEL